jgi:hypothetical protein
MTDRVESSAFDNDEQIHKKQHMLQITYQLARLTIMQNYNADWSAMLSARIGPIFIT